MAVITTQTAETLADLKGLATTKRMAPYDSSLWAWTLGDYSETKPEDLDSNIVKANSTALTVGAWVRQRASSITTRQDGTNAIVRRAESKANDFINARDMGVVANGNADDSKALQSAIDAASHYGRPLQLPAGTILCKTTINLQGRSVDMRGVPQLTTIKAGEPMEVLLDAREGNKTYFSPFNITDVRLDGDHKVSEANLAICSRHGYNLTNVWSENAYRAFWEKDCYLSRHWNLRTGTCGIGYHLKGSNHSSLFVACSAVGCSEAGILIEALGSQPDGNHALTFTGCDVEFGDGYGVILSANTSARFDGCYLGEKISKSVIYNTGGVIEINGGIAFCGSSANAYLSQPIGGRTYFRGTRIAGQEYSPGEGQQAVVANLSTLAFVSAAQQAAGTGVVRFENIDGYLAVGGEPTLPGNLLDYGPQRTAFAPRWGRIYGAANTDTTVSVNVGVDGQPNAQRVTCVSVTGPTPKLGLFAPLANTFWQTGKPMYLVLVYKSSKPVTVNMAVSPFGTVICPLGTAPVTASTKSYIKLDALPGNAPSGVLEAFISGAAPGDFIELQEVYLADATMHKTSIGDLAALYKC